jgi:hypothetical protein
MPFPLLTIGFATVVPLLLHQRPDMNGKKERLCYGDDGSTEQVNITRG